MCAIAIAIKLRESVYGGAAKFHQYRQNAIAKHVYTDRYGDGTGRCSSCFRQRRLAPPRSDRVTLASTLAPFSSALSRLLSSHSPAAASISIYIAVSVASPPVFCPSLSRTSGRSKTGKPWVAALAARRRDVAVTTRGRGE